MPGENVQDWSTTAATNATADSSINWAEGMTRAGVNDSARGMMAAIAKWRNLTNGSITTGGSANAQTFSSGLSYTGAPPTGLVVRLKIGPALTNTTATTLNMDSIGAVTIKDEAGSDLIAGALRAGGYALLVYNGTNWILLNFSLAALVVTGNAAIGGTFSAAGAATFTSTLSVGSAAAFSGAVSAAGAVALTSTLNVGSAAVFSGTLNVTGAVSAGADITWAGVAWASSSPTITAGAGSFANVSGAFYSKQYGKLVAMRGRVTITSAGSAVGGLSVSTPITANVTNANNAIAGRETTTGKMVDGVVNSSEIQMTFYDGTTVISSGSVVNFGGVYEAS